MDARCLLFAAAAALLWSFPASMGAGEETERQYSWDPYGYVLYCPCMGRFGNQASHFLGALAFAQHLNRTLAIPPWRTYVRQRNVPFRDWFQLEPVQSYYKALPLEDFMSQLAPAHWPPGQRIGYCYRLHGSGDDCMMKEGNPFGPFWDELGVSFNGSEFTGLTYDLDNEHYRRQWMEHYPPDQHPVLAFKGAPASFPVKKQHRHLQKYVKWSTAITGKVDGYIKENLEGEAFIGVHLRIGTDWERACGHVTGQRNFMESPHCLEGRPDLGLTQDICLPSRELIVRQIKSLSKRSGGIQRVFVASDVRDPKIDDLREKLGRGFKVHYLNPDLPQLDLALLARADYFVGSCASSFSAFVRRERDVGGKPSEYWGVVVARPPGQGAGEREKTEL